ncbi:MAG: protein kinase [Planctomycetes bacterium]|nr:protein kinase [Planctomycetota bacterium]
MDKSDGRQPAGADGAAPREPDQPGSAGGGRGMPGKIPAEQVPTVEMKPQGGVQADNLRQNTVSAGSGQAGVPADNKTPQKITVDDVIRLWGPTAVAEATPGMTVKSPDRRATDSIGGTWDHLHVREHHVAQADADHPQPPAYKLAQFLGEGGMGVVYQARQTSVDRIIALKFLKSESTGDEVQKSKFLSEAVVMADLDHPNVAPIHELGRDAEGRLFYAMKMVRGESWEKVLPRKGLAENIEILMAACNAVAFAHSRGVIHRDLKPENIMLGEFGEVLVMDWGMTVTIGPGGKAQPLNRTVAFGGTPVYMAPEMAVGDPDRLGPASDVYLLGGILYQIVTGLPPHIGDSAAECIANAANNVIRPTDRKGELVEIALRAMASRPQDRYQSAKEFQSAIRLYQDHSQSIELTRTALSDLEQAKRSGHYEDFAQSIFAFRHAITLWNGNVQALRCMTMARLAFARCAYDKGDYDLAGSLVDPAEPLHEGIARQIRAALESRRTRQRQVRVLRYTAAGLACLIFAVIAVGFFWIRAERNMAVESYNRAEEARLKLEYASYLSGVRLVQGFLKEGRMDAARQLLDRCPRHLRAWEWGYLSRQCRIARADLTVGGDIKSACYSPDGRLVLVAGDGGAEVFLRAGWKKVAEFCRDNPVQAAGFIGGSERIFTAQENGRLTVWNVADGKKIFERTNSEKLGSAAATLDGRSIYVVCGTKIVQYDIESDREVRSLDFIPGCMAVSPDGSLLAAGSLSGEVGVWRTADGVKVFGEKAHEQMSGTICFSPDGSLMASAGKDGLVKLWDARTWKAAGTFGGQRREILAAAFTPDGKALLTTGRARRIVLWDVAAARQISSTPCGIGGALAFAPGDAGLDGEFIAACKDGSAKAWNLLDITSGLYPHTVLRPPAGLSILCARFSPSGSNILTTNGHLCVWDGGTGGLVARMPEETSPQVAGWLDEKIVLAGTWGGELIKYDLAGKTVADRAKAHQDWIGMLAVDSKSKRFATCGGDGFIRLFSHGDIRKSDALKADWSGMAFSPADGSFAVAADGWIYIWPAGEKPDYAQCLWRLKAPWGRVVCLAFSPDGRSIFAGTAQGKGHLIDVRTGQPAAKMAGHSQQIKEAAFSPDGRRLATVGFDQTVRLWDVATGAEVLTMDEHSSGVWTVDFSPDGLMLVSGSADRSAIIRRADKWK